VVKDIMNKIEKAKIEVEGVQKQLTELKKIKGDV
jgi:uncharacterized membrane protein YjjP (DUF1212 family)